MQIDADNKVMISREGRSSNNHVGHVAGAAYMVYIAIIVKYRDTEVYSLLLISIIMNLKTIHCEVMAPSKEPTDKPSYHTVGK